MQRAYLVTGRKKRRAGGAVRALHLLRAVIAAVAGVALSGCTDIAGPRYVASVDVQVPAVVQAELSMLTDFTVDADILNTGSATVLYERWCNWRVEQLVNGTWAPAYAPVCAPDAREIYQLRFGERALHRYPAHRTWRAGNGAQVPGTYRLLLTVFSGAPGMPLTDLEATVVVSNTFTVR